MSTFRLAELSLLVYFRQQRTYELLDLKQNTYLKDLGVAVLVKKIRIRDKEGSQQGEAKDFGPLQLLYSSR